MLYLLSFVAVVICWALLGFFVVRPGESVVVLRRGRQRGVIHKAGLHYELPLGRELFRIPTHRQVYAAEELVQVPDGDHVLVKARMEYSVSDPAKAAFGSADLLDYLNHQVRRELRSCAETRQPAPTDRIQVALGIVGVEVHNFSVTFDVQVQQEVLRPATARVWAQAVAAAHQILQHQALGGMREVQDAAETYPKPVRGDIRQLALITVDSVAANLPKLGE